MQKKLEQKLKNALKSAGLSEGLAAGFADSDEQEINKFINTLTGTSGEETVDVDNFLVSDEFNEWLEQNGFDKLLEKNVNIQSSHDRKVTKALQTAVKKITGNEDDDKNTKPDKPDDKNMPEWAKGLLAEIQTLKTEKAQNSKLEQAKQLMGASQLPEKVQQRWINRLNLDGETELADQIKELETEYAELAGPDTYKLQTSKQKEKGALSADDEKSIAAAASNF